MYLLDTISIELVVAKIIFFIVTYKISAHQTKDLRSPPFAIATSAFATSVSAYFLRCHSRVI